MNDSALRVAQLIAAPLKYVDVPEREDFAIQLAFLLRAGVTPNRGIASASITAGSIRYKRCCSKATQRIYTGRFHIYTQITCGVENARRQLFATVSGMRDAEK